MITKQKVSSSIDKASADIDWCWSILATLRSSKNRASVSPEIANLQSRLIGALWTLDDVYREIHVERRRLVSAKSRLDPSWFRKRMAGLASYQGGIRHAISIAKAVGDGFAWIFYSNEKKLIDAHLKLPRQVHLPPKIGRIGERAFVEKFKVFEGRLVLYHGITTFLRMGDVSFYDFTERRICNVGELKTEHIQGNEYRINLGFVYGGNFAPMVDISHVIKEVDAKPQMMPGQAAKLKRQLAQIAKARSPKEDRVSQSTSQQGHFYFAELDNLIEASSVRALKSKKVGKGLLITTLRVAGNLPLSKRLLADGKFQVGKKLDGVTAAAQSIVDPALPDNSLLLSSLGVSERGIPGLMAGAIPIFWWPLKVENLRDLLFSNVIAMTLYNPAHFWRSLRDRGFNLSIGDRAQVASAKKRVGRRVFELHNLRYFEMLITHFLISENDALAMIDAALEFPNPDGVPMRVEISPQLRF